MEKDYVTNREAIKERLGEIFFNCSVDQLKYITSRLKAASKWAAAELAGYKPNTIYKWDNKDELEEAVSLLLILSLWDAVAVMVKEHYRAALILIDALESESKKERIEAALEIIRNTRDRIVGSSSWSTIRWEVLKRDKFRCVYCGAKASDGIKLEVDHVIPRSAGGENSLSNLVTACERCNRAKRDEILTPGLLIFLDRIIQER